MLIVVAHQNVGAFAREGERDGTADAAIRAGDDCLLAGQAAVTFIAGFAIVRRGIHCSAAAGHGLLLPSEWRLRIGTHLDSPLNAGRNGTSPEPFPPHELNRRW